VRTAQLRQRSYSAIVDDRGESRRRQGACLPACAGMPEPSSDEPVERLEVDGGGVLEVAEPSPEHQVRALTRDRLALCRQASPLTPLCLRGIPSPTTWRAPDVAFSVTAARRSAQRPSASPRGRRLANTPRRNGFVVLRVTHSPPVALYPADKASSRTHDRAHPARS
jgi:hypothetical protein